MNEIKNLYKLSNELNISFEQAGLIYLTYINDFETLITYSNGSQTVRKIKNGNEVTALGKSKSYHSSEIEDLLNKQIIEKYVNYDKDFNTYEIHLQKWVINKYLVELFKEEEEDYEYAEEFFNAYPKFHNSDGKRLALKVVESRVEEVFKPYLKKVDPEEHKIVLAWVKQNKDSINMKITKFIESEYWKGNDYKYRTTTGGNWE